jgi:hypothetical protein
MRILVLIVKAEPEQKKEKVLFCSCAIKNLLRMRE